MTIINRRFGRKVGDGMSADAPYRIKVGFDKREIAKNPGKFKEPAKLQGFLICRNSVNVGGFGHAIAYDHMELLGYSKEQIAEAMRLQLDAEPGDLLPAGLHVWIPNDAVRVNGRWTFPGTYHEELQWHAHGLKCHGDGCRALRRQDNGTLKEIECVPIGTPGKTDAECCRESVAGDCKSHSRWIFRLFRLVDGRPTPLCRDFGFSATYRLDTRSEYAQLSILEELNRAADALDGRIANLSGLLYFSLQEKRYDHGRKIGKVGQIRLSLDNTTIDLRASGQAERLAAAIVSVPERIETSTTPDRAERPQGTPAPATDPSPQQPERAADTPPAVDAEPMSDEQLLETLSAYVSSRSGCSPDAVAEIVWFNMNGNRKQPPLDWFLSDDPAAQRIGRARLREICAREFAKDEFKEWFVDSHVREGVAS